MKLKKVTKAIILLIVLFFITSAVPGAAKEKSADEVARKLANPNTPLAKLTLKTQYQLYTGDLPGAFGPEWMFSFNITPVVPNFLSRCLGFE